MGHVPIYVSYTYSSSFSFRPTGNKGERPLRETAVERWWEKDGGRDSENDGRQEERADRVKKEVTTWLTWLVLTWKPYTCPGILLCGARGTHPFPDDILQNYTKLLSCRWERRFENIARGCPWYRACVSRCLFLHRRCHWLSRPVTSTFELRSLVT